MKAIETVYKGYRFRSRTEARWAVFFDHLGIAWEYEREGFELADGSRYLPDFFVRMRADHPARQRHRGAGYWIEVKGDAASESERGVLQKLCTESGHHGYLVLGAPGENCPIRFDMAPTGQEQAFPGLLGLLVAKIKRNWQDPGFALFWSAVVQECSPLGEDLHERVGRAIIAARGARFEFGEHG